MLSVTRFCYFVENKNLIKYLQIHSIAEQNTRYIHYFDHDRSHKSTRKRDANFEKPLQFYLFSSEISEIFDPSYRLSSHSLFCLSTTRNALFCEVLHLTTKFTNYICKFCYCTVASKNRSDKT